jgi:hypothetical protein
VRLSWGLVIGRCYGAYFRYRRRGFSGKSCFFVFGIIIGAAFALGVSIFLRDSLFSF